jgi:hypothetical protein
MNTWRIAVGLVSILVGTPIVIQERPTHLAPGHWAYDSALARRLWVNVW